MDNDLIKEKVHQAALLLQELHLDCWLTFVRETATVRDPVLEFLVTADLTWHSALIVHASGRTVAIVGNYDCQTVVDTGAFDEVIGYVEGIRAPLLAELRTRNPRTIAVNYSVESEICDGITHGMFLALLEILREAGLADRVVSSEALVSALRQRKTSTELARMKEAIRHTEEIYTLVGSRLHAGMTEEDVAAIMREEVQQRGLGYAWDPAGCPAVFTGPDTAGAHYRPTSRVVQAGHIVNMDFGVRVNGYVSDIQRTFYVLRGGEASAPSEVQRGFDTIRGAIERARAALTPGVKGLEVDTVARQHITDAGYAEFPHALGHQVGRFAHDGTALLGPAWEKYGRKPFFPLEEGMVFTLEPRLTVPGYGVVTMEEMVVVRPHGAEYLSVPQDTLRCVR